VLRLWQPAAVAAGAAAVVAYVGSVDPNETGHYPTCPFLWATGLFCPGCGALRTIHALAHLDVPTALSLNVLVVGFVPLLALWFGRWSYRRWTGRPRRWLAPTWSLWGLLALVVSFWVLRNLPGLEVLAP
jgi:hypothetical protein